MSLDLQLSQLQNWFSRSLSASGRINRAGSWRLAPIPWVKCHKICTRLGGKPHGNRYRDRHTVTERQRQRQRYSCGYRNRGKSVRQATRLAAHTCQRVLNDAGCCQGCRWEGSNIYWLLLATSSQYQLTAVLAELFSSWISHLLGSSAKSYARTRIDRQVKEMCKVVQWQIYSDKCWLEIRRRHPPSAVSPSSSSHSPILTASSQGAVSWKLMLPAQIECQSILVFNLKSAPRCRHRIFSRSCFW